MGLKFKITLCVLAGAAALISKLPAQWVLNRAGGEALGAQTQAIGTVWRGQIIGADDFGPISYRVKPLQIISGGAPLSFGTQMPGISITGKAGRSQLRDVSITGQVWTFSNVDPRLAGLSGNFEARIDRLDFDLTSPQIGCTDAQGTVQTNVLAANESLWSWAGPDMSGPISCEDGALKIDMAGNGRGAKAGLVFKVMPDGGYTARADVQTQDAAAQTVMTLFGFTPAGSGYRLQEAGRWQ